MKLIKRNDLIVIGVILSVCLCMLLPNINKKENLVATITVKGEVYQTIDLSKVEEEYTIQIDTTLRATLTVNKNEIYFSYAECRDKICINTGKLTHAGQTAACLPAKIVVSLSGTNSQYDALTY